jgi:hypothetical protein
VSRQFARLDLTLFLGLPERNLLRRDLLPCKFVQPVQPRNFRLLHGNLALGLALPELPHLQQRRQWKVKASSHAGDPF